jgi:DNA mismatch repair protein MSH4
MKYIELVVGSSFYPQSLRIKFEPSEGSMLIDLSTIVSLELIQNLADAKSKQCLFGILNETLTPMGSRLLRSNILQPSTDAAKISERYEALAELTLKEGMFFEVRQGMTVIAGIVIIVPYNTNLVAMKDFVDTDRLLASASSTHCLLLAADAVKLTAFQLVIMKTKGNIQEMEQSINQVVVLKTFVDSIKPVWQALTTAASQELQKICQVGDNGV